MSRIESDAVSTFTTYVPQDLRNIKMVEIEFP